MALRVRMPLVVCNLFDEICVGGDCIVYKNSMSFIFHYNLLFYREDQGIIGSSKFMAVNAGSSWIQRSLH